MPRKVQIAIDEQGDLLVPSAVREQIPLKPGMVLVVESDADEALRLRVQRKRPVLVEKDGVLVAQVKARGDIEEAMQRVRDQRSRDVWLFEGQ